MGAAPRNELHVPWISALAGQRPVVVAALLILVVVAVSILNPAFASRQNALDLLVAAAPAVIVGCGMTFVVLTGEIDISVGSLMGLLAALMGVLASPKHAGWSPALVGIIVLAGGAGVGLVNGLLVTVARVPSIIATLGMLTVLRGATQFVLGGEWVTDLPAGLRELGTGELIGVPWSLWVAAAVAAAAVLVSRGTRLGIKVYAVGGNADAAAMARVSPRRVKLFAFALTGALTGLATLVSVPQQSVIEAGIGEGFELVVVTAVVVGGTAIKGGLGGIAGTVVAAVLLGSIRTILVFLKLGDMATYWERAIQGAFILAAVLADHARASRAEAAA